MANFPILALDHPTFAPLGHVSTQEINLIIHFSQNFNYSMSFSHVGVFRHCYPYKGLDIVALFPPFSIRKSVNIPELAWILFLSSVEFEYLQHINHTPLRPEITMCCNIYSSSPIVVLWELRSSAIHYCLTCIIHKYFMFGMNYT